MVGNKDSCHTSNTILSLFSGFDRLWSDNTPIKPENRNRNEENRRQIVDFIADNIISDSKTISKAIGLKPSRTRDYLKQLVDERFLPNCRTIFGQMGERKEKKRYFQANCHIKKRPTATSKNGQLPHQNLLN